MKRSKCARVLPRLTLVLTLGGWGGFKKLGEAGLSAIGNSTTGEYGMDRRHCTHPSDAFAIGLVTWCQRCSGWRYKRVGAEPGSTLASASTVVFESHFLPAEETDPSTLLALASRLFRCAQEWGEDHFESEQLELDWTWQSLSD